MKSQMPFRNLFHSTSLTLILLSSFVLPLVARAEESDNATQLAARLAAVQQGTSYVRLKMTVKKDADEKVFQLQIKERRAAADIDVIYQILWPNTRKGEAVLMRRSGGVHPSGSLLIPPNRLQPITGSKLREPVFGSDLAYHDLTEDFFSWEKQAFAGSEVVDGKECRILQSTPGPDQHSFYRSVKTWIDPERLVPLRVEKIDAAGNMALRLDTVRVSKDDNNNHIPATVYVRRAGSGTVTELEGSKSERNVRYDESDFTPEGLTNLKRPR